MSGDPGIPNDSGSSDIPRVSPFDAIRHTAENGEDYWSARELGPMFGYNKWQNFRAVIERARDICLLLYQDVSRHFAAEWKNVSLGSGAEREIEEYHLSRSASCLMLLCSDMKKPEVVHALAYMAGTLLDVATDPKFAQSSGYIPELDGIAITKEQRTIGQIVRAFQHLRSMRHYRVAPYYVDLYFPDQRIAIECDENGHANHTNYTPQNERARQTFIECTLACQFVRYNPDAPDFNIGDVINRIMRLVYRCDEQPTESEAS